MTDNQSYSDTAAQRWTHFGQPWFPADSQNPRQERPRGAFFPTASSRHRYALARLRRSLTGEGNHG
jgi:hypothetical protein